MSRRAISLARSPGGSASWTNDMASGYRARSRRSIALLRASIGDSSSAPDGWMRNTETPFQGNAIGGVLILYLQVLARNVLIQPFYFPWLWIRSWIDRI